MKKIKSRYINVFVILVFFLGVIFFNYSENKSKYNEAPSDKWSKEVVVGSGNASRAARVIKEEEKIIVAYDDGNQLKISVTDNLGKKILEKSYEINEDLLLGTSLTKSQDGYVYAYNSTSKSEPYMEKIYLDKDFEKIGEDVEKNITNIKQLDNNLVLISDPNKIILRNTEENIDSEINAKNVSEVAVSKLKDKYMIAFIEDKMCIKTAIVENKEFKNLKSIYQISSSYNTSYDNLACSNDGNYGYVLLEQKSKGKFIDTKMIQFQLNSDEECKVSNVGINGCRMVHDNIGTYSENGARFIGILPIDEGAYGSEKIMDYIIKDGEIQSVENVSRLNEICVLPYINDDIISFLSFKEEDMYNVNIASTDSSFKEINNNNRKLESKLAFNETVEQMAYALSYIIIIASKWIIPAVFICAIISFFDYKIKAKGKTIAFLAVSIMVTFIKTQEIYYRVYREASGATSILSSTFIGISICIILSIISYLIGLNRYNREEDSSFIINFGIALIIDTVLTLILFTPYI